MMELAVQKRATQDLQRCLRDGAYRLGHGGEPVATAVDAVLGLCREETVIFRNSVARRYYAADYDVGLTQQLAVEGVADREARLMATYHVVEARQGNCQL